MFRDVPGCSGMFWNVPCSGFYRRPFTNVLIEGAVQAALWKLEGDSSLADRTTLTLTQIADLLNFVLRSNKFQFDGTIYEH